MELTPSRSSPYYLPLLALLFVTSLVCGYLFIQPINHLDWVTTAQFLRYMVHLQNPYDETLGMDADLLAYDQSGYEGLDYAPWTVFYFGILAYATTRLIIALSVAAWIVVIVDSGRPVTLLLVLHPTFLMLWAAGNIDFLVNGVGLWLIVRGSRGWRLGAAIMLLAIKPQVLPLLIGLECARVLWERDWGALGTIGTLFVVAIVLFPRWLEWPAELLGTYVDYAQGEKTAQEVRYGGGYPFSVLGAWGVWAALGVTALIGLLMIRRLTEWRTLAVLLSFVWTPYVNPYSYTVLLVLFRKTPAWRTLLYLGASLAMLPVLFNAWHERERIGILLFLLLTALLSAPDDENTEEAIAARHGRPLFLPARWWVAGLNRMRKNLSGMISS
jgi:hypothetical protein